MGIRSSSLQASFDMSRFFLFVVVYLTVIHPLSTGAVEVSFEDFERAFIGSLVDYQKMSYELEATMKLQMGEKPIVVNTVEEQGYLDMEHQSYYYRDNIVIENQSNPNTGEPVIKKRTENLEKNGFFLYAELDDDNNISYLSSKLNIDPNWIDRLKFQFIAFLLGYVNLSDKNLPLLEEIKKGNVSIEKQNDTYTLESITNDWRIKLRFVLVPRFCIQELVFTRNSENIQPLDMKKLSVIVQKTSPTGNPVEYELKQFFQGGTRKGISIAPKESTTTVRIGSIQTKQQFTKSDFVLSVSIKNGTPVFMQDAPQIQYIWMDGKIEPKTDELMLRIAQGDNKFIPGVSKPRFWLMAIGILFIVLGFSLKAKTLIQQWREK
ncbi:hypothetical protein FACS18942_06820 [Planctomycetales bacterium]|nr:hypothetical protein FACS18942_06820 [Planctomycetales bacterium]